MLANLNVADLRMNMEQNHTTLSRSIRMYLMFINNLCIQ